MIQLFKKLWPYLVGAGSALVMILAFFIPAVQDQWDRYESRRVIDQYVTLGDEFFDEEQFALAEEAYSKAFHLSDDKRIDIEMKRLQAKIEQINVDSNWDTKGAVELEDVDFQFLLHLQRDPQMKKQRIMTLNSYGIFLQARKQSKAARKVLHEAIQLDSTDARAYVNLGILLDAEHRYDEAVNNYLSALRLEPDNIWAAYYLGVLYGRQHRIPEALNLLERARRLDPEDEDIRHALDSLRMISN